MKYILGLLIAFSMTANASFYIPDGAVTRAKLALQAVGAVNIATHVAGYAALNTDDVILMNGASGTLTLFDASLAANKGRILTIQHAGTSLTQTYAIATVGGQTVGGIASGLYVLFTAGESLRIVSDGTNWQIMQHVATTPWVDAGALTVTGSGSNPTKGVNTEHFYWKRDGTQCFFRYEYVQTAATGGVNGVGAYLFALPAGLLTDPAFINDNAQSTTNMTGSVLGKGNIANNAAMTGGNSGNLVIKSWNKTTGLMYALLVASEASSADGDLTIIAGGTAVGNVSLFFSYAGHANLTLFSEGSYPVVNWRQ